jgi:hypothetical protein
MDTFKKIVESTVNESPVGSPGRTSNTDADKFIDENPAIIQEFRRIIVKMGGKAVARRVIDRINFTKKVNEAKEDVVDYLREVGFKVKKVYPGEKSREIEFYKTNDAKEAFEDLKTAGFLSDWDISFDGLKSLTVTEI